MPSNQSPSDNELLAGVADHYQSSERRTSWIGRMFPTLDFYCQFGLNVYRSSLKARHGKYDAVQWSRTSYQVLQSLESVGVRAEVSGLQHVRKLDGPCVFVGNHMSMLETIVLPAIIQPIMDVTFVVKQSLMDYPVFRHIVRSREPVAVSRENPREDFKVVMAEGVERLGKGISIVVFPQTTRSDTFDPSQFNTIGVKLALRAGVPVVPIALKTDAWGNGTWIKDLGPIRSCKKVHFAFGEPIPIEGRGDAQHQAVIGFIESKLREWEVDGDEK